MSKIGKKQTKKTEALTLPWPRNNGVIALGTSTTQYFNFLETRDMY